MIYFILFCFVTFDVSIVYFFVVATLSHLPLLAAAGKLTTQVAKVTLNKRKQENGNVVTIIEIMTFNPKICA